MKAYHYQLSTHYLVSPGHDPTDLLGSPESASNSQIKFLSEGRRTALLGKTNPDVEPLFFLCPEAHNS